MIEFWVVMCKLKCMISGNTFVFLLQMLCCLGVPFSPSLCLEYSLGIWTLETMGKRPRASQRPWP